MTGDISLNASMRSNLLSLQQISKLQDRTQLRLSTGLKVNSAIDNPSSYYTASALNNRADDLSALLDSMGQGIQTIKAANEGIEKAEDLITQMKAVAEQVNTGSFVPDKAYFIQEVGENGAVVSTAEELRDAVNSGKETICVYGNIDLGDISTTGGLSLQENQKLVGVNYFGNFSDGEGFSSISATSTAAKNLIGITKTGCLVSDLSLNYENSADTSTPNVILVNGNSVEIDLQNLTITANFSINNSYNRAGICLSNGANVNIRKNLDIYLSGKNSWGIYSLSGSNLDVLSDSNVNINIQGENARGIGAGQHSRATFDTSSKINISANGNYSIGLYCADTNFNLYGNLKIISEQFGILNLISSSNNINIGTSAQIYFNTNTQIFYNNYDGNGNNIIEINKGAKIAIEKDGNTKWYEVKKDYYDENDSGTDNTITADNFETTLNVGQTSSWQTPADIIAAEEAEAAQKTEEEKQNYQAYQKQFNSALSQYDSLIKDSSYKGVNLLQEDKLKVNFNEDKTSHLLVQGVDMSSDALGLLAADWQTGKDVQNSLDQVLSVRDKLRSAASKLGNYYSIITERQTFTENLINVLQEGADKLTLADMNEESANMLSLQTQQSLAINSLSLASQAAQGVLRLF